MKTRLNLMLFFIFTLTVFSVQIVFAQDEIAVVYDTEANLELADYFVNDLILLFNEKKSIRAQLKRKYPFVQDLKKFKKIQEGFLLFKQKGKLTVRYIHVKNRISKYFYFDLSRIAKRGVSLQCLYQIYKKDLSRLKKKLAVFPLVNKTGDRKKDPWAQILTKAFENELELTEKVIVLSMNQEKNLWQRLGKKNEQMNQKDYFGAMSLLNTDAVAYGSYYLKKNRLQVEMTIFRKEQKKPVYQVKDFLPLNEDLFAGALLLSRKISEQVIKKLPPQKIKIAQKPKIEKKLVQVIPKEETKEDKPVIIIEKNEPPQLEMKSAFIDPPKPKIQSSPVLIEKNYSTQGFIETGISIWGDFNGFSKDSSAQSLQGGHFISYFFSDRFFGGCREELIYDIKKDYRVRLGLTLGAALPLGDSAFIFNSLHAGYELNADSVENHFYTADEIGFKFKLKKHFLLTLSGFYSIEWFNQKYSDKIKLLLAFSCYY